MADITTFSNADFESIKADIKTFLSQRTEFQDFNFEGSAISVLIDSLAYTANYMAVHANMSLTEVFLDSCQLRSSAVSHSKSVGYFPRQTSSAQTEVTIEYIHPSGQTNISSIILPEGSRFSSGDSSSYEFVTTRSYQVLEERDDDGLAVNPGTYKATATVREGKILERSYFYPVSAGVPVFSLPDTDVDTDYFRVYVTGPGETNATEYLVATDIVDVDTDSKVFFLQEALDGSLEFYFGDGVIGQKPVVDSSIVIKYLVTAGPDANGASGFSLVTSLEYGISSINPDLVTTTATDRAAYGANKQDIDSIKYTAPKAFAAQNRAVTEGDYQALMLREFGFIETISVWGGETNDPPMYGKALVSVKPRDGTYLSPAVKEDIMERVLRKYSIVGIIPEIVDPDYTYVQVATNVSYERERTFKSEGTLVSEISAAISAYFREVVTKFNSVFRFSNLVRRIDEIDTAILGNVTSFKLGKKITPVPNTESSFQFKFGNPLVSGTVQSGSITTLSGSVITFKDSDGKIDLYTGGVLTTQAIGSVNYTNGVVTIPSFIFEVASGTEVSFFAECSNQDVFANQNNLIVLDFSDIKMTRFYKNSVITNTISVAG